MAGCMRGRDLYNGRNVSGASMWLEVGAIYIYIYIYVCVCVCVNKLRKHHDGITARSK